jgi:hypothetical protein
MTTTDYLVQSLAWVFFAMLLGSFLGTAFAPPRKDDD